MTRKTPVPSLRVRRLAAGDADLAELADQFNRADWDVSLKRFSGDSLRRFLSDPSRIYLIAYQDNELAGAVHGYIHLHPTGVQYLFIDEVDTVVAHRRKGVATVLMQSVFDIAKAQNVEEVWVGADDNNLPAQALYQSLKPDEIEHGPIFSFKTKTQGPA